MNGLLFDAYWTIHITPESHCSYASFETNVRMTNFTPLIKAVLAIFRPRKFTMTLFADHNGLRALKESPFAQVLTVPLIDAATPAVIGPCVLVSEPAVPGGSYVSYPPSVKSAAAAAAAAGEAFPVGSASSSVGDSEPSTAGPSPTAGAGPSSSTVSDVTSAPALDSPTSTASAPPAAAVPSAASAIALRRQASAAKLLGGGVATSAPGGLAAYVMSSKCHTEFVGEYHSILGNFRLVTGPGGPEASSTPRPESTLELPAAASAMLSLPRIKYVVERELAQARGLAKVRTESM